MRAIAFVCAVVGHRWHVEDGSTEGEILVSCSRCGHREHADSTERAPQARGEVDSDSRALRDGRRRY